MTGVELKSWRDGVGLSQSGLASYLGVSTNTVARWERDEMAIPSFLDLALSELGRRLSAKDARPESVVYIRRVMEEQGISTRQVAERAQKLGYKLSPGYLHNLAVGAVTNPSLGSIYALAAGLGRPEQELIDVFAAALKPRTKPSTKFSKNKSPN